MAYEDQSERSKALDQREHNRDASAKRVMLRGQDSVTGNWVNIAAKDNGDGTFSILTAGTVSSSTLPTGAATSATQTNGSQVTRIVDAAGTNQAAVNASGQVAIQNFPAAQA